MLRFQLEAKLLSPNIPSLSTTRHITHSSRPSRIGLEAQRSDIIIQYGKPAPKLLQHTKATHSINPKLNILSINLLREQCLIKMCINLDETPHSFSLLRRPTATSDLDELLHLVFISALGQLEHGVVA